MNREQQKIMDENMKAAKQAQWEAQQQDKIPGGGMIGVASQESALNQTAQDPRRELMYRIDRRVDELLAQIAALRAAHSILEYASYDTIDVLRKLEIGGIR